MKKCTKCLVEKDESGFDKDASKNDGLMCWCRSCKKIYHEANKDWINVQRKIDYEADKDKLSAKREVYYYKKVHGITLEQRAEMITKQDNKCFICGVVFNTGKGTAPCVDHDHFMEEKGLHIIRKVLCDVCNRGLGFFKDDPAVLRAAADYLDHHHARNSLI